MCAQMHEMPLAISIHSKLQKSQLAYEPQLSWEGDKIQATIKLRFR